MTSTSFPGYSIVVSVDQNTDNCFSNLGDQVVADGDAICATLSDAARCSYLPDRVKHLSGQDARFSKIEAAFNTAATEVCEDDPFLFYYSGHGDRVGDEVYLAPYDANGRTMSAMISSREFAHLLSAIRSRRKLIILDACFSGGFSGVGGLLKGAKSIPQNLISQMATGEGAVTIASSRANEGSLILYGDDNSLFTKHLLIGLKGGGGHDADGFVRVFDLFNYVAEHVRADAPDQAPVYAAYHQDSNFAVAYCANVSKRQHLAHFHSTEGASNAQSAVEVFASLYPQGPLGEEIWARSGGDTSRLDLSGQGRTKWIRALRAIELGSNVTLADLIAAAREDYPHNRRLEELSRLLQ